MPTLNWIGKDAVVNHHKEVPFRLLKCNEKLSAGSPSRSTPVGLLLGEERGGEVGNLLVQGDNLEALKALLPYYAGQVKCIYIDPPYNTGNEGWVYNDNVNSPEMREWLGKVVGGETEDLSRHDKWLCMMYPRFVLLHQILREVIQCHCEDAARFFPTIAKHPVRKQSPGYEETASCLAVTVFARRLPRRTVERP